MGSNLVTPEISDNEISRIEKEQLRQRAALEHKKLSGKGAFKHEDG